MSNYKFKYQCTNCDAEYTESQITYLCPACNKTNIQNLPPKGVLKTNYDYPKLIKERITFSQLKQNSFLQLLPISNTKNLPNLNIGNTPLYYIEKINNSKLTFNLFLKGFAGLCTYSYFTN